MSGSSQRRYLIKVQNPRDLSHFYKIWVTEDELREFWNWYNTVIKPKRKPRETRSTEKIHSAFTNTGAHP